MKQGLVWYDNDPSKSLDDKMNEAAVRYKEKFGVEPNVCYVHPSHLNGLHASTVNMRLIKAPQVLPNHLWLEAE